MSRLPPKPLEELSVEQQAVHDNFTKLSYASFGANGEKFVWKDDKDALVGPFPFFISYPQVGQALDPVFRSFAKLPVPADVRETTILTVGGHYQAAYETYSHIPQGIDAGLTKEQSEALARGERPADLNEACSVAYEISKYLVSRRGPLPQDLWDKAVKTLGLDPTIGLLHYAGFYSYVCVALNALDVPAAA